MASSHPSHSGSTEPWWWLSFADSCLPEGEQFLGGLFLRGYTLPAVITESHLRDLNPGGEVEATELPLEIDVPAKWAERLLSREEVAEMDREMSGQADPCPDNRGADCCGGACLSDG